MPIYEYQCTKCDHKLEALRKISDEPLVDCPECGKPSLTKLVSAASFRLKGGGWYETDFKTGNKKQLAESESAGSGGDSSSKGDSGKDDKKVAASNAKETTKTTTPKESKESKKASAKAS